ncbi:Cation diffusion facilitator family transporter [uncultured Paludibacter sp.]|uniref:Cation diffusion facilitator family transporter n=1 Tax=uncultured Paludibacter sp. TaxID=497635 RepID=A0A653AA19_9BACT|nr:Cation diffusion facilitator family transporter [uncultured Paludibacter sp.]
MHSHNEHTHSHTHEVKNIKAAFFLNFFFSLVEIVGGIFTNSVSILSDAIHDMGDSISLGMAWYFQKISTKKSDTKYTYGYKRFSVMGALITSIVLIVGSVIILSEAIPRLFHPQETQAKGMFLLAILGIIINGAALFQLKKGDSLNEKVVSLHFLEDVLGWAAVLIGATVIYFWKIYIIDPILSIAIALFVLRNVYKNVREISRIILQGTPHSIETENLKSEILKIDENIQSIHDFHLWTVDGNYNVLTIHLVLKEKRNLEQLSALKDKIRQTLNEKEVEHATIEFETPNEECCFENCCE